MNFLKETIEDIGYSGHVPSDIVFIGSTLSGHGCTWDEFEVLADVDYDNGFGAAKVADDLIILFSDGATMWRHEYDGSENWRYSMPVVAPDDIKPIKSLIVPSHRCGWMSVEEIQDESKEK